MCCRSILSSRMMTRKFFTIAFVCVVTVSCGDVSEWHQQQDEIRDGLFLPGESTKGAELLQQAASQGNTDAESDLTLARLLGIGLTQDIEWAAKSSLALLDSGGARAHTTQGLLLSHNLTGKELTDEERRTQALSHYLVAAINKDPLAQIIVARHYINKGDCEAALQYLRKAAASVVPSTSEEVRANIPVRYVWPEDDTMSLINQLPTLDELQFMEYLAQNGDVDAALRAAIVLVTPIPGLKYDPELAVLYLRQAVEANSTSAKVMLAAIHLHKSLQPDKNDTLELLQEALAHGDLTAHTYLGLLYLEGFQDVPRNLRKAKFHLEEGVKIASVEAFYLLGKLYNTPEGPGNPIDAVHLWEVAAAFGHVPSAFKVAESYNKKLQVAALTTVTPDGTSALINKLCEDTLPLYRLVALSGKWRNLHHLAFDDYTQGHTSSALMKYLLLSDLGYNAAHINAGRILDSERSTLYDDDEAATNEVVKIWRRAADAGIALGYLRLGDLFYYGDGVSKNLTAAAEHYNSAAQLGSAHGMFSAAQAVEWGEGTEQNLEKARELYEVILDTHSEALVPVTLALYRMEVLIALSRFFKTNLYFHPLLQHPGQYLYTFVPPWDISIMIVLGIFITTMVTNRVRR
ncbi:protein sel-1 homolog 2-like [Macrobrachium rosenbergii]|uniref:protein sel-1 homolog 2-like n=1 Tax=Macrobrachium rosenbergii TaxID=79674 RepID=UPI0034D5E466